MGKIRLMMALLVCSNAIASGEIIPGVLYDGWTTGPVGLEKIAHDITPGTIVILSEQHDLKMHHSHQEQFLGALKKHSAANGISVGMEFFRYPDQPLVDRYFAGDLPEPEFLKKLKWGSLPFDFYRAIVWFPFASGGLTAALNAPSWLTSKISKNGLEALTAEDWKAMPPGFALGNDGYYMRFKALMTDGHIPEQKVRNYFAAQSTWDDTMAWNAVRHLAARPGDVLVIIVGDFHAAYGGGLPDRIRARTNARIINISQVDLGGMSDPEKFMAVAPHPIWEARADYVWTSLEIK